MITKTRARELGASGLAIPQAGLRPESFAWLRAGGRPIASLPVMVAFFPDGVRSIVDGRHRITLAREAGEKHVRGVLIGYGPRGGERWRFSGWIPI